MASKIKSWIKKVIESVFLNGLDWGTFKYFYNLGRRFFFCSLMSKSDDSIEFVTTKLRVLTHEIDKGLHMQTPRKGFGKDKVRKIIQYMNAYRQFNNIEYDYEAYLDAFEILEEYQTSKDVFMLDTSFMPDLDTLKINVANNDRIPSATRKTFFDENLPYSSMICDRHSVRDFQNIAIEKEIFEEALSVAKCSPSACNRQSFRAMLVNVENDARAILDLQGGFKGSEAYNCILVGVDLSLYYYPGEINAALLDGGMFAMNLIYALRDKKIDSCPLIWDDNSYKRKELNKILPIKDNIYIVMIIACGYALNTRKLLISPRRSTKNIEIPN